jgi:cobalt-zinc-cadmium efflux system outer membrane protein
VARARAEARRAEAQVGAVRAARVPDVEARFGVRRLEEAGGAGLVAGVSLPLPLWSRGAGTLRGAEAERDAAALRVTALERRIESERRSARERLAAALRAYHRVRNAAPLSRQALDALRDGYRAGRIGYLDLHEAQRADLDARLALDQAAADVWRARAAVDRLEPAPPLDRRWEDPR